MTYILFNTILYTLYRRLYTIYCRLCEKQLLNVNLYFNTDLVPEDAAHMIRFQTTPQPIVPLTDSYDINNEFRHPVRPKIGKSEQ